MQEAANHFQNDAPNEVNPRVLLPVTEEARECMSSSSRLEPEQVLRLQTIVAEQVSLKGGTFLSASWPEIELRPLTFVWEIADMLAAKGIELEDVRLEGNAVASCMDPDTALQDLEVLFRLKGDTRADLFASRDIVIDCLCYHLPKGVSNRDRHMIAAAYMQRLFITPPQRDPEDPSWAMYSMPGTAGSPTVHCKFVQKAEPTDVLDEYAVHIILNRDELKDFVDNYERAFTLPKQILPAVEFCCLIGTPSDALAVLTPAGRKASRRRPSASPVKQAVLSSPPHRTQSPFPQPMHAAKTAYEPPAPSTWVETVKSTYKGCVACFSCTGAADATRA